MDELLKLVEDSDRDANPEWLKDELFAIKRLHIADTFVKAANSGKRFNNAQQSTVAYVIGMTDEAPTEYPKGMSVDYGRMDPPDIDSDIADKGRAEVIEDLTKTFKNVASISTLSYFQGKSSIRDAARVLKIPLADVNRALKDNDASLAMNESYDYYDWFVRTAKGREFDRKHPEVVALARRLHGRVKQFGKHASGYVVSREPLENFAPVESTKEGEERKPVVALDMGEAESLGLIKVDVLGLKALSVIGDTLKMVKERHNYDIDLPNLPLDDPAVYRDISRGFTKGLFQVEQPAYTGLIMDMGGVLNFDQLVASNALVRPGAMKTIGPEYIARKNGQAVVEYIHPKTEYFTKTTYGLPTLFQEHQMLLCVELGGMNMGEANLVRRGLGKKDVEKIKPFKEKFIKNATHYIGRAKAEKVWADLELGAEYNFNISHSVAYSMLSYRTAWLKHYYPVEFMAATIRNESDSDSVTDYLIEARRLGIDIKLPHVNKSGLYAEPEGNNSIRMGLRNVKYCGEGAANAIILQRPYDNYEHFSTVAGKKGSGINKRVVANLNKIGGAYFKDNPRTGDEKENLYEVLGIPSFAQMSLDPMIEHKLSATDEYDETGVHMIRGMVRGIQRKDHWARVDVLDEVGNINVFIDPSTTIESGTMYLFLIAGNSVIRAVSLDDVNEDSKSAFVRYLYGALPELEEGEYASIAFKPRKTKAGKDMATVVAVDHLGEMHSILVWPSDFDVAKNQCFAGRKWKGKVKEKDEDGKITKFFNPGRKFDYRAARSDG